MNEPDLLSQNINNFVVLARGESKNSGNYEDWTGQFKTATNYYADKARGNRELHVVVIRKDSVSAELWQWAKEDAKAMDLGKKSPWVDPNAYLNPSGELEKSCKDPRLQKRLRKEANHYGVNLD